MVLVVGGYVVVMKDPSINTRWASDRDAVDAVLGAIERHLARRHMTSYYHWTIGVTNSPGRRQDTLRSPGFWRVWKVADDNVAQRVFSHFVRMGMMGDVISDAHGRYVYLF